MIYLITDDYGTRQYAWTLRGAVAWFPYCGSHVTVRNVLTGRLVCGRRILEIAA